jgi:hypothetical protein
MKRSRVFTMQAMISEKVENSPAPSVTNNDQDNAAGIEIEIHAHQGGTEVDDDRLGEAADAGGECLANDKGASRRRTHHVAMQDAEIPFPNRGNSIEDRDEQHALREDAGSQEIKIGNCA